MGRHSLPSPGSYINKRWAPPSPWELKNAKSVARVNIVDKSSINRNNYCTTCGRPRSRWKAKIQTVARHGGKRFSAERDLFKPEPYPSQESLTASFSLLPSSRSFSTLNDDAKVLETVSKNGACSPVHPVGENETGDESVKLLTAKGRAVNRRTHRDR